MAQFSMRSLLTRFAAAALMTTVATAFSLGVGQQKAFAQDTAPKAPPKKELSQKEQAKILDEQIAQTEGYIKKLEAEVVQQEKDNKSTYKSDTALRVYKQKLQVLQNAKSTGQGFSVKSETNGSYTVKINGHVGGLEEQMKKRGVEPMTYEPMSSQEAAAQNSPAVKHFNYPKADGSNEISHSVDVHLDNGSLSGMTLKHFTDNGKGGINVSELEVGFDASTGMMTMQKEQANGLGFSIVPVNDPAMQELGKRLQATYQNTGEIDKTMAGYVSQRASKVGLLGSARPGRPAPGSQLSAPTLEVK